MPSPTEWLRILGAWWRDNGEEIGTVAVGSVPQIVAGPSPSGLEVSFQPFDASGLGHWMIVYDGDATPEPIFVENAEGVMDVLELWFVP